MLKFLSYRSQPFIYLWYGFLNCRLLNKGAGEFCVILSYDLSRLLNHLLLGRRGPT